MSKRIQGMHRDGSVGLEIEGCGGSLKGWSGWDFPWEKVYGEPRAEPLEPQH